MHLEGVRSGLGGRIVTRRQGGGQGYEIFPDEDCG